MYWRLVFISRGLKPRVRLTRNQSYITKMRPMKESRWPGAISQILKTCEATCAFFTEAVNKTRYSNMNVSDNCGICMVKITKRALIKLDPCGHMFHQTCWDKHVFIRIPVDCCLCRRAITTTTTTPYLRRITSMEHGSS